MRLGPATPATATTDGPKIPELISCLGPADLEAQLRRDALEGLTAPVKTIPSKWFYDYTGSMLFDEITRLPEYYLTRAERQILRERAASIVEVTRADTLVELGCGLSEKTRVLLDAFGRTGDLRRFLPFDVDGEVLKLAAAQLLERYPDLEVQGIVGDFERHLDAIKVPGRSLVIFLGSTIGNLNRPQRARLLSQISSSLKPGDWFLLGVDLVKDVERLEAAYNDRAGISAAFNRNILSVLNSRLGGNFDVDSFEHVARFNSGTEEMEMCLKACGPQNVRLDSLDLEVSFKDSELLHTEISAKFRRPGIEGELAEAGLQPRRWWTDAGEDFALSLSEKSGRPL
ncbi:MAG TPA: L-histidine N(alpha)-methyltransferase [Actinomycetota bacterium]|nr:L-histidine N(alpha)-methyltransferase [Actinomycetota bacterium]